MDSAPDISEQWFARYLAEHGHAGGDDPEPDLGVAKRPDFLVGKAGVKAICEVKEFTSTRLRDQLAAAGGVATLPADVTYAPVRDAVKRAAAQLKPLEHLGFPLVVVLANPHGADVELDPEELIFALYGNPTISFMVDETGPVTSPEIVAGRDGRLGRDHAYISAIVTLHRRAHADDWWHEWRERYCAGRAEDERDPDDVTAMARVSVDYIDARRTAEAREQIPEGDYLFVRLFETQACLAGTAVTVPEQLFDGPRDERWAARVDGWERIR